MSRPHTRNRHHATARMIPIVEATTTERAAADSRSFPQKALLINHSLRRLDRRLRAPHLSREITQNYGHYYIEMVENIAAWLKGAQARARR